MKTEIIEMPAYKVYGISVRTDINKTAQDCPELWDKFTPEVMKALGRYTFGISKMVNESDLDYYAAIDCEGKPTPEGFKEITLPAGLYLKCEGSSLEELSKIYCYLYCEWSDSAYAMDHAKASYEMYEKGFAETQKYAIFAPLVKK